MDLDFLSVPENRKIIGLYESSNTDRLDNFVYTPLQSSHPSLSLMFDYLRKKDHPLDTMERTRELLDVVLAGEHDESKNPIVKQISKFSVMFNQYHPNQLQFYTKLIQHVNSLQAERDISLEAAVSGLEHADEVMRRIFPRREDAQIFHQNHLNYQISAYELGKHLRALLDCQEEGHPPTLVALLNLENAVVDYRNNELKRIYSLTSQTS
jgi:hypothetical protein